MPSTYKVINEDQSPLTPEQIAELMEGVAGAVKVFSEESRERLTKLNNLTVSETEDLYGKSFDDLLQQIEESINRLPQGLVIYRAEIADDLGRIATNILLDRQHYEETKDPRSAPGTYPVQWPNEWVRLYIADEHFALLKVLTTHRVAEQDSKRWLDLNFTVGLEWEGKHINLSDTLRGYPYSKSARKTVNDAFRAHHTDYTEQAKALATEGKSFFELYTFSSVREALASNVFIGRQNYATSDVVVAKEPFEFDESLAHRFWDVICLTNQKLLQVKRQPDAKLEGMVKILDYTDVEEVFFPGEPLTVFPNSFYGKLSRLHFTGAKLFAPGTESEECNGNLKLSYQSLNKKHKDKHIQADCYLFFVEGVQYIKVNDLYATEKAI